MVIVIWVLTAAALGAMYWAFRVNERFALRMLIFAGVGAVYLLGIMQGMDTSWFTGTTGAILAIALWPRKQSGSGESGTPRDEPEDPPPPQP